MKLLTTNSQPIILSQSRSTSPVVSQPAINTTQRIPSNQAIPVGPINPFLAMNQSSSSRISLSPPH